MDVLPVGVERFTYEIEGWGVGEIAIDGRVLVGHDLPSRWRRAAADPSFHIEGRIPALHPAAPLASPNTFDFPPTAFSPSAFSPTTPKGGTRPPEVRLADDRAPVCADFVADFVEHVRRQLTGEETSYGDVALDLSWCTPFQANLAAALLAVPWGEVVSYGELGALAGRPGAARAAGSFCAQNRFALVMPCHRVVGATGIGGYGSSGVELKRRLLALEGVDL